MGTREGCFRHADEEGPEPGGPPPAGLKAVNPASPPVPVGRTGSRSARFLCAAWAAALLLPARVAPPAAGPPEILWGANLPLPQAYGGTVSALMRTADGDFVLCGSCLYEDNPYSADMLLVRLSEDRVLWSQTYGNDGFEQRNDDAHAVAEAADGGFVLAGRSHGSPAEGGTGVIVRTDARGNLLWGRVGEVPGALASNFFDVIRRADGLFVAVGTFWPAAEGRGFKDGYLECFTGDGERVWSRACGGAANDFLLCAAEAPGAHVLAAGRSASFDAAGKESGYLVKLDSLGGVVMESTYPAAFTFDAILATRRGDIVLAGGSKPPWSMQVSVLDHLGEVLRVLAFPDEWHTFDLLEGPDDTILLGGSESSLDGRSTSGLVARIALSGELLWKLPITGLIENTRGIAPTKDGGYLVTGMGGFEDGQRPSGIYIARTGPEVMSAEEFLRGDANGDERVDVSDVVMILRHLFAGSGDLRCLDAGDVNDDGALDLADGVYLAMFLFCGGPTIPEPFPQRGTDPTPDALNCLAAP